jgi:hypothetical protein
MDTLRLALRALRWRPGTALTTLLVAVASVATAVTAPLWGRAAQEALLATRLAATPVEQSGLSTAVTVDVGAGPDAVADALAETRQASAAVGLDRWFAPGGTVVRTNDAVPVQPAGASVPTHEARIAWVDGLCGHVRIVAGRCPSGGADVLVSTRTATALGLSPGSRLGLSLAGRIAQRTVAGTYDIRDPESAYWFGYDYTDHGTALGSDGMDRLDTLFVTRDAMGALVTAVRQVEVHRPLRPGTMHLADADGVRRTVSDAVTSSSRSTDPERTSSSLPAVLASVGRDGRTVQVAALLVSAQLLVLAWYVLFLLVTAATEERSDEVVVAKLRGLRPRSTAAFTLAESLLLLVAAVPLGYVAGRFATQALVTAFLPPGTPVRFDATSAAAGLVALLGGVVAAALAARRVLRQPVLALLRRAGERRSWQRSLALDAVLVTLTAAAVLSLAQRSQAAASSDVLVLLLPVLLAFTIGLVGSRLLPVLLAVAVRGTRAGRRGAAFLAVRQAGRRRGGARTAVLLTVATALAVFAADAFDAAAATRASQAAMQVGADRVLHVEAGSLPQLVAAVDRADPAGRTMMAAAELVPEGEQGRILAVDAGRLPAVGAWQPSWSDLAVSELAHRLHPTTPEPLLLPGPDLAVTAGLDLFGRDRTPAGESPIDPVRGPLVLFADLRGADGRTTTVRLGQVHGDTRTYRATLPDCTAPCALTALRLDRGAGVLGDVFGTLRVTGLESPAGRPVAGALRAERWQVGRTRVTEPGRKPPVAVRSPGSDGLVWDLRARDSDQVVVGVAEAPLDLPVVLADGMPAAEPYPGSDGGSFGTSIGGQPTVHRVVGRVHVLPRSGRLGTLVDLRYAALRSPDAAPDQLQVWLSPGAGRDAVTRLQAQGVRVVGSESLAAARRDLDRSASALSFLLLLFAAVAAVGLALAGVVTDLFVVGRRRAREVAAMRSLGLSPRTVAGAGALEQLLVLGTGVLLGTVAGFLAVRLALPRVPLGTGLAVPPLLAPALLVIAATVVAVLATVAALSAGSARLLLRAGTPDRLREGS